MASGHAGSVNPKSDTYYYPHVGPQKRTRLVTETYEYDAPFKYGNIAVTRWALDSREGHGVELDLTDTIRIVERAPIVRVAVIGSACTPPGYVLLECDPIPEWRNRCEVKSALPARFRAESLWGMHVRTDVLSTRTAPVEGEFGPPGARGYEPMPEMQTELYPSTRTRPIYHKSHYRENPLAGMSCAVFEIPPSLIVVVSGGSQAPQWRDDNFPGDNHYSFRTIRTTVQVRREEAGT
jgi:hypothetical protein